MKAVEDPDHRRFLKKALLGEKKTNREDPY